MKSVALLCILKNFPDVISALSLSAYERQRDMSESVKY